MALGGQHVANAGCHGDLGQRHACHLPDVSGAIEIEHDGKGCGEEVKGYYFLSYYHGTDSWQER